MSLGGNVLGESALADVGLIPLAVEEEAPGPGGPIGGPHEEPIIIDPFTIEVDGISVKPLVDSLSIDGEMGRQGTCSFTLVNVSAVPQIGQSIRIKYYESVLFVGALDSVKIVSNNSQTYKTYACECTDNSYLLFRKKVRRKFTNISLATLAFAILTDELLNDRVSMGRIDNFPNIPIVDADNVTIFDMFDDAATSVGAFFYIDIDRRLNFINQFPDGPQGVIDENIVEESSLNFDRETFRNEQTVVVTGTPATQGEDPLTISVSAANSDLIPAQAILEGTSGIYSDIESITHPTSNTSTELFKLGFAYAKILLSIRGTMRETLNVKIRNRVYATGQLVAVSIPHFARSGNWIIQRVSMTDIAGRWLSVSLDLSPATFRRRAQGLWLDVVRKGSVVVLPPTAVVSQSQLLSTPGTHSFTVPQGATFLQATIRAGGGGGGGGAYHNYFGRVIFNNGGPGGHGGLVISVIPVTPGEVLTMVVGSGGAFGAASQQINTGASAIGGNGGNGTVSQFKRGSSVMASANGGQGGFGGQSNAASGLSATYPRASDGYGFGDVITQGGAGNGGIGGKGNPLTAATAGGNGSILLEW